MKLCSASMSEDVFFKLFLNDMFVIICLRMKVSFCLVPFHICAPEYRVSTPEISASWGTRGGS